MITLHIIDIHFEPNNTFPHIWILHVALFDPIASPLLQYPTFRPPDRDRVHPPEAGLGGAGPEGAPPHRREVRLGHRPQPLPPRRRPRRLRRRRDRQSGLYAASLVR